VGVIPILETPVVGGQTDITELECWSNGVLECWMKIRLRSMGRVLVPIAIWSSARLKKTCNYILMVVQANFSDDPYMLGSAFSITPTLQHSSTP
jgi:hypothetical protein